MSFFSLDEVCFSSFSHTVSIGFNDFKWNKYNIVSGLIISKKIFWDHDGFGDFSWVAAADATLQIRGEGSYPDLEIRGWVVSKKIFSALRASVWAKNKGGSRAPWPLFWIRHWLVSWSALFVETVFKSSFSFSDVLSSGCTAVPCVSWSQLGMQGLR